VYIGPPVYDGAMTCEDAPCCGCCGTSLYGSNESYSSYDEPYEPDEDNYDYDQDEDCEPNHACDSCDGPRGTWINGEFVPNPDSGWECSYCGRPCPEGAHE
jgi:hypothetical protein